MSEPLIQFTIERAGERLDKLIVAHLPSFSRSQIQTMIKDGLVSVDGEPVKAGIKLHSGQVITVEAPPTTETTVEAEDIALEVVYEDAHLAVLEKPAGLVVHPGVGNESGTLVNALLARWPEIGTMDDPEGRHGIVHRLDKDTSGLIVVARTSAALTDLMAQFQVRSVEKVYLALLERTPQTRTGRIDAPIGRDPKQRKRMAVLRDGKPAISEYVIIDDRFRDDAALVEFHLHTGRTHQIRVHAAFIGCPIIGDRVYGYRKQRIRMKRLFLHAARLSFDHPVTGERMTFESGLPVGLRDIMEKLRP